jgi:hypothetical protein
VPNEKQYAYVAGFQCSRVERSKIRINFTPPPHQSVRAVFPHTAFL